MKIWENFEGIKYIINQQVGCGYLFMENEAFKISSREDTKGGEMEVWMGGKGGGGLCSRITFNEKDHMKQNGV